MSNAFGSFDPSFMGIRLYKKKKFESPDGQQGLTVYETFLRERNESERDGLDYLLYYYCAEHEKKHFFDYFLSYFGNCNFRLKLMTAVNAQRYILTFTDVCIPTPIRKWNRFSENEKSAIRKIAKRKFGKEIPDFDDPNGPNADMWAEIVRCQDIIDRFYAEDSLTVQGNTINTSHLLEANAIISQALRIHHHLDEETCVFFMEQMTEHLFESVKIIYMLASLLPGTPVLPILNQFNAIITWCLMGDSSEDGSEAPIERFTRVCEFFSANATLIPKMMPGDLYELLDKKLARKPLVETFENCLTKHKRFRDIILDAMTPDSADRSSGREEFMRFLDIYKDLLRYTMRSFLSDMDSYLICGRFNSETKTEWFTPPTIVETDSFGFEVDAENSLYKPLDYAVQDGRKICVRFLQKDTMDNPVFKGSDATGLIYSMINFLDQTFNFNNDIDLINQDAFRRTYREKNKIDFISI
jgi:hypothetical protein